MALDIGRLVGFIDLDAKGAVKGVKETDAAIAQGGKRWSKTAGDAGGKAGKSAGTRMASSMLTALKPLAVGLVGALGVNAVVNYARDAIGAASDLEQSIGAVDAVFGEYADNVHAKSEKAAQSLGLSKNAFNELITVTGALLKNKGITDYAAQAENLLTIGADLAAQFGGPTSDAVDALNAALRGESDPIERYAVTLNETAVNAKLAEMGLEGLEGKAAEQAKTMARLQIITEQTADAHGTFAREADTAAGKAERQKAEMADLRAEIGERLLPIYHAWLDFMANTGTPALAGFLNAVIDLVEGLAPLVTAGGDMVKFFNDLPGPIKTTALALAGIKLAQLTGLTDFAKGMGGGLASGARDGLSGIRLQAMYMGDAFKGASTQAGGLKSAIGVGARAGLRGAMTGLAGAGKGVVSFLGGPWGLAIMGAATVVGFLIKAHQDHKRAVEEIRTTLDEETGAITENTEAWVANELQKSGTADAAERLGVPLETLRRAALGEKDALAELNRELQVHEDRLNTAVLTQGDKSSGVMDQLRSDFDLVTGAVDGTNGKLVEAQDAQEQMNKLMGETAPAAEDAAVAVDSLGLGMEHSAVAADTYGAAVEEVTDATEDAHQATLDLAEAMGKIIDQAYSAQEADIAYQASLDDLTESIKENGETHDITTEKGRANQSALLDLASSAYAAAEANLANGGSLESVQGSMSTARAEFVRGAQQMGYTKAEANALADQLGLTDAAVAGLGAEIGSLRGKTVTVEVDGTGRSVIAVDNLKDAIRGVRGKTVYVTVVESFQRAHMPAGYRRSVAQADGGFWSGGVQRFADGGVDEAGRHVPRVPQMGGPAYGKRGILWGEQETGWEAYISGKPGMRERNLAVLSQAADRLGVAVTPAANGAVFGVGSSTSGVVTAVLAEQDRALLRAVASRPIQTSVQVGSRTVFAAASEGRASYGAPARWSDAPRIGGVAP